MKIISTLLFSLICFQLSACNQDSEVIKENNDNNTNSDTLKVKITIGTQAYSATLENNATASAFQARLPMTINMHELNGNEKFFDLANSLPVNASRPDNIQTGDLMIYGSNTLVLFYKSFSTSYSYTRLGRINDPGGLATALGSGNITVTFEMEK